MKTKYFKTLFLTLSLCFIFNAAFSTSDTLIMPVNISYLYSGWGGNWGGQYNLSFDQNRYMPPGDMMYVEIETFTICCGNTPWHKLTDYYYPINWYNDTANYAFTDSTNGTIHTSNDIYSGPGSVASIYIRFVYISTTGNQTIYANVSNATYDLAPTHFVNVLPIINGSPCDNPLNVNFQLPVNCSRCQNGSSSEDMHISAYFGDGNDTSYTVCCPGQHPTFNLNHSYNSVGTFHPTFYVSNSYGGGTVALSVSNRTPAAAITASSTTFCSGDSVILNAVYNPNRTYQWKKGGIDIPGATASSYTTRIGGAYRVTVTNTMGGCSRTTAPATILTKYQFPVPTITAQGPTTFCTGDSVVLTANTGAGLIYKWKKDGILISGATSIDYSAKTTGEYKVQELNSYGCRRTSGGVTVAVPCRESDDQSESAALDKLYIYPNPANEFVVVSYEFGVGDQIIITDVLGKTLFTKIITQTTSNFKLQTLNFSKGIYFVKAGEAVGKFVKE
jgi:hypothetical protein